MVMALVLGSATTVFAQAGPIVAKEERSFIFRNHAYIPQEKQVAVVNLASGKLASIYRAKHYIHDFAASGQYLFLANDTAGVRMLDMTNPGRLTPVSLIPASPGFAAKYVHVVEHRGGLVTRQLFVTEYTRGQWQLSIYDVTTPTRPRFKGKKALPGQASNSTALIASLDARHILVSLYTVGVLILDVQDPANVTVVKTLPRTGGATGLVVKNKRAYVRTGLSTSQSRLAIWDLSNLANPRELNRILINSAAGDSNNLSVRRRGGRRYAFMGGCCGAGYNSEEFIVVDVTNPANPRQKRLRLHHPAGFDVVVYDVDIVGNRAYVSGWKPPEPPKFQYDYYLVEIDISTPMNPGIIGFTKVPAGRVVAR